MENWLRFGINKKILIDEYKKMEDTQFPLAPCDDNLYDLYSELVSMDMHIMGLVSKYLATNEIDTDKLICDYEFLLLCKNININSTEFIALLEYKSKLDKLIMMFK